MSKQRSPQPRRGSGGNDPVPSISARMNRSSSIDLSFTEGLPKVVGSDDAIQTMDLMTEFHEEGEELLEEEEDDDRYLNMLERQISAWREQRAQNELNYKEEDDETFEGLVNGEGGGSSSAFYGSASSSLGPELQGNDTNTNGNNSSNGNNNDREPDRTWLPSSTTSHHHSSDSNNNNNNNGTKDSPTPKKTYAQAASVGVSNSKGQNGETAEEESKEKQQQEKMDAKEKDEEEEYDEEYDDDEEEDGVSRRKKMLAPLPPSNAKPTKPILNKVTKYGSLTPPPTPSPKKVKKGVPSTGEQQEDTKGVRFSLPLTEIHGEGDEYTTEDDDGYFATSHYFFNDEEDDEEDLYDFDSPHDEDDMAESLYSNFELAQYLSLYPPAGAKTEDDGSDLNTAEGREIGSGFNYLDPAALQAIMRSLSFPNSLPTNDNQEESEAEEFSLAPPPIMTTPKSDIEATFSSESWKGFLSGKPPSYSSSPTSEATTLMDFTDVSSEPNWLESSSVDDRIDSYVEVVDTAKKKLVWEKVFPTYSAMDNVHYYLRNSTLALTSSPIFKTYKKYMNL